MRLSDCFSDLIAYVAYFLKSVERRQATFEEIKNDIHRLLAASEQCGRNDIFNPEDYNLARFAICAWIDESILSTDWQGLAAWRKEQLQRLFYNTTDAGEAFFERLNSLGMHQRDVREVYYLCLAMGFKGRYCNEGDEFLLDQLNTSNLKLLTGSSVGIPSLSRTDLFPEAYPTEMPEMQAGKSASSFNAFTLAFLGGPVLFFIALYLVYHFILNNIGESIVKTVA